MARGAPVVGKSGLTGEKRALPRVLLHGTSLRCLPGILERGLIKGECARATDPAFAESVKGCIFLTEEEPIARFFASAASMKAGETTGKLDDLAILYIDTLKARLHGTDFIPTTYVEQLGGHEWLTCEEIAPDNIALVKVIPSERGRPEIFDSPEKVRKQLCSDPRYQAEAGAFCRAVGASRSAR
ncbi:MAG: hypothetical protein KGJ23_08625 [Euryarchaeota archaeon]|nr:hypothetical protein [Euryarchaeota archaeon]MDE1836667.1 hypothetical protein [Euryarchaeota archaeon]MDE1880304.1 hypothetical protein [Euryarchaeota archaeon]MDE2044637.1 hypothetical protein [Thermoplasmata archaeon]